MPRLLTLAISVGLLILPSIVPSASADPVRIQGGFVFLGNSPSDSFGVDLLLEGDGFIYVGEAPWSPEYLEDFFCTDCSPSTVQSPFRLRFSPTQVIDPSSNSSCPGCGYEGDFEFRVREPGGDAPFTMTGSLTGFAPGSTVPAFRSRFIGNGTLFASDAFVLFDFASDPAPVPEPSTLLLLASGLGLTLRRRASRGVRAAMSYVRRGPV